MSTYAATIEGILRQREREEEAHSRFLGDPAKMDKLAAAITSQISPSAAKPKLSKFSSQTEAYDSTIPDDHPLRNFGSELHERLGRVLSDRRSVGVNPGEMAAALAEKMMAEPGKSGLSRYEESAEYKRRADSKWFGLAGEDEKLRKPGGSRYDVWLKQRQQAEQPENIAAALKKAGRNEEAEEVLREANPIATPGGALAQAGIGAVAGGIFGGPGGALLGAAGGVLSEVVGRPISKAITESEWYNARKGPLTATRSDVSLTEAAGLGALGLATGFIKGGGGLKGLITGAIGGAVGTGLATDTGKALAAEIAPYAVAGIQIDKALFKTFLVPKAAGKAIAANPSAKVIADAQDAVSTAEKEIQGTGVFDNILKRVLDPRGKELGVNEDVIKGFQTIGRSFTASGREAIRSDARLSVMEKAFTDHLNKSEDIWNTIANAVKSDKIQTAVELPEGMLVGTKLGTGTQNTRDLARYVTKTFASLDHIGVDEALRHPSGDFAIGIVEAGKRQKARAFTDPAKAEAAKTAATNRIIAEARIRQAKAGKAEAIVGRVLAETSEQDEIYKIADEILDPTVLKDKIMPPKPKRVRKAPTASVARVVDDVAATTGIKPTDAFDKVTARANAIEADPAARSIISSASEPTEISAALSEGTSTISAEATTKRIVASRNRAPKRKVVEEVTETKATDEEIISELKGKKLDVATEAEAAEKRILAPVGTVRKAGNAITEVVETKLGPQEVTYRKGERIPALKKFQEAIEVEAKQAEYVSELRTYSKLSPEEALEEVKGITELHRQGKVTAEEVIYRTNQITEAQTLDEFDNAGNFVGNKFASENGMGDWLAMFDPLIKHMRGVVGNKTFMSVFGLGAGAYAMFMDPQTGGVGAPAEAGIASHFVQGLKAVKDVGKASAALMKNMADAGYVVPSHVPDDKFLLKYGEYQKGLRGTDKGGPAKILADFQNWSSKAPKDSLRYKVMSPGMIFDEVLGIGKQLMNNPAVFRASFQAAEFNNITRSSKVVTNILRDAGVESVRGEVRQAYKPLTDGMLKQVEFDWRSDKVKDLTKEVDTITKNKKKYPADVVEASLKAAQDELAMHQQSLEGLKDFLPKYHSTWESITKDLAAKHSSVRIFLALGDNAQFEKYPFMKSIGLSNDEKVAVGRLKEHLAQYKQRIKDVKEETISGDYAPHILHPDFKPREFTKLVGREEDAANYLRLHRRSFNSRPLMPDIESSMLRYVSDTERRIQNIDFWKIQGWDAVYHKSAGIPVIHNAFKTIREGMTPIDMTFGNKFAQRLAEFESVKRLFLSPSATLKHMIKQTADLAQRGIGETVEAYPLAAKSMLIRLTEANPKIRSAMSGLGITAKTDQDKMMLDYFRSLVPAHGVRKMLLDIGMPMHEEIFARGKSVWGKIQDIGGSGINFAEQWDRGLTTVLGHQIANKAGLTVEQALYGTYDMILKNNFLSRELNPKWLQNPKVKAVMMFQGTPFKIFERRLTYAMRSGRVVKDLGKEVFDLTKKDFQTGTMTNTRMLLKELRDIRSIVKSGEHNLKANVFLDALNKEVDFYGTPIINTFAKDIAIVAAATYGGGTIGMNLYHHFFHLPFLKPDTHLPTLSLNPSLMAVFNGVAAYQKREEGDDEWLTTKIFQRWLGSGWHAAIPDPIRKLHRISNDDIPAIYKGSLAKYMFAIPAKEKK